MLFFLSRGVIKDDRQDFLPAHALLRRERDDRNLFGQEQRLTDLCNIAFKLALFDLVELVGDNHPRLARCAEPFRHRHVIARRLVTDINDLDAERQQTHRKIGLHQRAPALLLRL